jgi:hypothetical protein
MGLLSRIVDRAKCLAGAHDWSEWTTKSLGSCKQSRHCKRADCTKNESTITHDWPDFGYVSDQSCEQTRTCRWCDNQEKRTAEHHWEDWKYIREGECQQTRSCTRCGLVGNRDSHLWDVWKYASPTKCAQTRFCRRCPTGQESKQPAHGDHKWGPTERFDCHASKEVCLRCREVNIIRSGWVTMHRYGPWTPSHGQKLERRCPDCGNVERKDASEK